LLIQGGLSSTSGSTNTGPTAFAAVVYRIPTAATIGKLKVTVAPNSGTTPVSVLELCPIDGTSINIEQGGPMKDAPSFKCATNVTASPSSGGNTYEFDVSKLVPNGVLGVAILPTSPLDRVVLAPPDAESLPVQSVPESTSSQDVSNEATNGSTSAPPDSSLAPAPLGPTGPVLPDALPAPAASTAAGTAQGPPAQSRAAPIGSSGSFASSIPTPEGAAGTGVLLLAAGVVVAGVAWNAAGRSAVRSAIQARRAGPPG
jgi:hypothetical protein